jgi:hypothetical protein
MAGRRMASENGSEVTSEGRRKRGILEERPGLLLCKTDSTRHSTGFQTKAEERKVRRGSEETMTTGPKP